MNITAESVLRDLKEALEIAKGNKDTHVVVRDGAETLSKPLKKTDLTNYVKINELYMKHLGMFTDKVELDGKLDTEATIINIVEDKRE